MPKGSNQKIKLHFLMKIMLEETDDNHSLTMSQILAELKKYDITAERKSIYTDFQEMSDRLGVEIIKEQIGRETYYHVGAREFELAEVKLLIDAIQSSKFITQKKSRELIDKVKAFVSRHQAKQLQRQIYISDRVKAMNESVYYNVDNIHDAISNNRRIRFQYFNWDINKNMVPRRNGEFYEVSPWALAWEDENYYMVAYDAAAGIIKHFRVDKMAKISPVDDIREGEKLFKDFDMASYSKMNFSMYGGDKRKVHIAFPNKMCGIFIDRFGKDIRFMNIDDEHSSLAVDVAVSRQFMGWIFGLGPEVRVTGPEDVVSKMRQAASEFMENYR